MIFVTVGTELPFDRLMRAVDGWAGSDSRDEVFAQIGETEWRPSHMKYSKLLEPADCDRCFRSAKAIVSHAGMGTILSALRYQKPILVMPRRASLGEQRNEHQLATARRLLELGKVSVAFDDVELRAHLNRLEELPTSAAIGAHAQPELIDALREFILAGSPRDRR